jgi:hypothetical protein
MKTLLASMFVSSVGVCACSHNALEPGAGSDPGSGTGTLLVQGRAVAEPTSPNASADTAFMTSFDVDITLAGAPVTTGTVTVKSLTGTATLAYAPSGNSNARWSGDIANYDQVYELDIVSGSDKVSAVYVDGPDIHTFSAPMLGASLDPSIANTVTWNREAAAQIATIRVGDGGDALPITDSGTYSMPALALRYEKDQTKANTIRLTRSSSIAPKGAVAGSTFSVGIANELDVVATACTTCP